MNDINIHCDGENYRWSRLGRDYEEHRVTYDIVLCASAGVKWAV